MNNITSDVAVIGAGPSGTIVGGELAERNRSVTIFEKETFPRFHVGESLLPMSVPLLRDFGLDLDQVDYAKKKEGAVFYDPERKEEARFPFSRTQEGTFPYAHQVFRKEFDRDLAELAREKGAEIQFDTQIVDWEESSGSVRVTTESGRHMNFRYLVDASGQRAMMGRKHGTIHRVDDFGQVATFTHFHVENLERLEEVLDGGEVFVGLLEDAWAWCLPLPDSTVGVGVVEKDPRTELTPEETLESSFERCPLIGEMLAGAPMPETVHRCAGYSFINRRPHTDRTVALGDAYVFIDPIYATAIHRAVYSARRLAEELDRTLEENQRLELDDYLSKINRAHHVYVRMISRFYNSNWVENMFFASGRPERTVREITSVLAGDVWRDDNQFMDMLLHTENEIFPPLQLENRVSR